jgi:hypothetical protein
MDVDLSGARLMVRQLSGRFFGTCSDDRTWPVSTVAERPTPAVAPDNYRTFNRDQVDVFSYGITSFGRTNTDCGIARPSATRLQVEPSEAEELLRGQRHAGRRVRSIQLHDLRPAPLPRAGDGEGHSRFAVHVNPFAL